MLKAIRFYQYRIFADTTLPLSPITILIGPNNSGKTSALSAIRVFANLGDVRRVPRDNVVPFGQRESAQPTIDAIWDNDGITRVAWMPDRFPAAEVLQDPLGNMHRQQLSTARIFDLNPAAIAANVRLTKTLEMGEDGRGLPAVLTTLQDQSPERFEALNDEIKDWLPGFDRILFDTPTEGERAINLRTFEGRHAVPTDKLSAGTLLSLALLTICHLPNPPVLVGLEEPDSRIHPRLLRNLKNSLLRLTSPSAFGDEREPVQVVITTHSPYMVDLFQEELASIVLVEKQGLTSHFHRLSEIPHVEDILRDAKLGDAWYSGVLGGVPEPR